MKNARSDLIFVAIVVTWKVSSPLVCAMILQICGILQRSGLGHVFITLCMFPDDISPTRNNKIVLVLSGEEGKAEKTEIIAW